MITLYNVLSADGFIADKNGEEDFIPDALWEDFLILCSQFDVVVMGRKTYEAIQAYPKELSETFERLYIQKIVLSRNQNYQVKDGYTTAHSLSEISRLSGKVLLTSGSKLNTAMVKADMITEVLNYIVPVYLKEGISQFEQDSTPRLQLLQEETRSDGVQIRHLSVGHVR